MGFSVGLQGFRDFRDWEVCGCFGLRVSRLHEVRLLSTHFGAVLNTLSLSYPTGSVLLLHISKYAL